MFKVFLFLCMLIGSDIALADASVPSFKTPPTKYVNAKTIGGVISEPSGMLAVVDELLIGDQSEKAIDFWFDVSGPNLHSCSMAGTAMAVSRDSYEYTEGSCELQIKVKPDGAEIEDVGGHCKPDHCGARAYIDRINFRRDR